MPKPTLDEKTQKALEEVSPHTNGHSHILRRLVKASTIPAEPVPWLFRGRVPYSMLTLMAGDPGQGKSVMCRTFVAMATRGKGHPLWDMVPTEPQTVIWLTKEESVKHALIPNLITCGADMDRVLIPSPEDDENPELQELLFDSVGLADLERWLEETGAKIIVIDPLMGYLEAGTKVNDSLAIRLLLQRLIGLCERFGAALFGIVHLNKSSTGTPLQRVSGAGAWVQLARAVLFIGCDPDDHKVKAVEEVKHSLAASRPPVGFEINDEGLLSWLNESHLTADRMCEVKTVSKKDSKTKTAECKEWLEYELLKGPCMSQTLRQNAEEAGFSKSLFYIVADQVQRSEASQPTPGVGAGPKWWARPGFDWSTMGWEDDPFYEP